MAAYHLDTPSVHGEIAFEFPNTANSPTLAQYLADLPIVYAKLEAIGMTDVDTFVFIADTDLDKLCTKEHGIDLSFMDAVKFKSAIRKLRSEFARDREPESAAVPVSTEEQAHVDRVHLAAKQATDAQALFEKHLSQIEEHAVDMKSSVDSQFERINQTLLQRKQALHDKVENVV